MVEFTPSTVKAMAALLDAPDREVEAYLRPALPPFPPELGDDFGVTVEGRMWLSEVAYQFVSEAGRAGLVLKEIEYVRAGKVVKSKRWVRADGNKPPKPDGTPDDTPDEKPDTASLERAKIEKPLHPGVTVRKDAAGKEWVVKERVNKGAQAANEVVATDLARVAGVEVVPVHHVKLNGQDHLVSPKVDGTDLNRVPKAERRAALAKVPKEQIDDHALFDYAIGSTDPNHGNFMLSGGKMVALDKEQSLGRGAGQKTTATPPYFLSEVVPEGKAATAYTFDRPRVADMADSADKMADNLESEGKRREAVGVRNRAKVLKQLAAGQAEPTVGELIRLGDEAEAAAKAKQGFFGKLLGRR